MWNESDDEIFIKYLMEDTKRPVTGLDFASLYPSLIMTYNLSPEYMITKETSGSLKKMTKIAKKAMKNGEDLHKIMFRYGDSQILAYSVRHQNKNFGVLHDLMKYLYDKRTILKKPKVYYEILIEYIEKTNSKIIDNNNIVKFLSNKENKKIYESASNWDELIEIESSFLYAKQLNLSLITEFIKKSHVEEINIFNAISVICTKLNIEKTDKNIEKIKNILSHENDILTMDDIELNFGYYDAKQKALKVMTNTAYGESGNKISPFYILALAGGITSAGKYNLGLVIKECKKLDCGIKYGDSVTGDTPVLISKAKPIIPIRYRPINSKPIRYISNCECVLCQ